MEIISLLFAVLVIVSIFVYYFITHRYRVLLLTILSCGFIASYHFHLLIYIIIYTSINFYLGLKIPDSKSKLTLYRLGITFNLAQLILLKYASFAIDPAFQLFNLDIQVQNLSKIIMPFGISYFTLQGIGYLINVKMGWEKPERNFVNFLLYIIFYPKFLSGPIERSNHFLPQLSSLDTMNTHKIMEGLKIALIGFFQKTVIANQLAPLINNAYSDLNAYAGFDLWAVLLIQPFYLYFDFAGYTNIAIGFAKIYGIELLPNFNRPFLSENVTTFWKRFHMSLSLWFHDYVFRQFSFKYRKLGINAAVLGVFVTFFFFGIWHGAGWNFMVLGLLIAMAINYEFFTKKQRIKIGSKLPRPINKLISRLLNYLFYGVCLVFFFSQDLGSSMQFFSLLFKDISWPLVNPVNNLALFALSLGIVFLLWEFIQEDYKKLSDRLESVFNRNKLLRVIVYYTLTMGVLIFLGQKLTFIYQVF